MASRRLEFIDALRGLAILAVVLYHAFARWTDLVPYGDRYADMPLFAYGWLGVQLFFLISGFVIYMTLERCRNFQDFMLRRWLRLFPAMLICSLLLLAWSRAVPQAEGGARALRDLLPGLTFVEPSWWARVIGSPQGLLQGGFWSIFAEVKFYAVIGLVYFGVGPRASIAVVCGLFFVHLATQVAEGVFGVEPSQLRWAQKAIDLGSLGNFGWFAAGALYYLDFKERRGVLFVAALALSIASALSLSGSDASGRLPALCVCALFAAAVRSGAVQGALSRRTLAWFGFISYPLYLINETPMVTLIVDLGRAAPELPALLMPVLPLASLCVVAWAVAAWAEPLFKRAIDRPYRMARLVLRA